MSETWWTIPASGDSHQPDPPEVSAFAAGDEPRVERWVITLGAPTFTVTLQGAAR